MIQREVEFSAVGTGIIASFCWMAVALAEAVACSMYAHPLLAIVKAR